jgi:hypothetical protein
LPATISTGADAALLAHAIVESEHERLCSEASAVGVDDADLERLSALQVVRQWRARSAEEAA